MHLTPFLKRVALAKLLGFTLGALGYVIFGSTATLSGMFLLGMVGWFVTLGALVGILGFYQTIAVPGLHITVS